MMLFLFEPSADYLAEEQYAGDVSPEYVADWWAQEQWTREDRAQYMTREFWRWSCYWLTRDPDGP